MKVFILLLLFAKKNILCLFLILDFENFDYFCFCYELLCFIRRRKFKHFDTSKNWLKVTKKQFSRQYYKFWLEESIKVSLMPWSNTLYFLGTYIRRYGKCHVWRHKNTSKSTYFLEVSFPTSSSFLGVFMTSHMTLFVSLRHTHFV